MERKTEQVDEIEANHLELADWRRRMATLYAEVRRIAGTDPAMAHEPREMVTIQK